jgi:hypothetical protein
VAITAEKYPQKLELSPSLRVYRASTLAMWSIANGIGFATGESRQTTQDEHLRRGDGMLFTSDSLWTMLHGIVVGGAALLGLAAALFWLYATPVRAHPLPADLPDDRAFARLTVFIAVMLWTTVIIGTYIVFPPYRATPPAGTIDLAQYPRSLILADPATVWLHAFAMESKEHMPWIASMLATAVAFVSMRHRPLLSTDGPLRMMIGVLLTVCFVLVAFVSILGVFINKVAPLD